MSLLSKKHITASSALIVAAALFSQTAAAHPHVYSDLRSDIILDDQGRATAIHVEWIFDQGYTEAATEGMDTDKDGIYTAAELQPVVDENIKALKEYRYFVAAKANGKDIAYADVTEYGQRINDQGRLSMTFVVPFATPVDLRTGEFTYKIYDPDFFIAYDYIKGETVTAIGNLPKDCVINVGTLAFDESIEQTKQELADKPPDWQPDQPQDFGSLFAQPVSVSCKPAAS